MAERIEQPPVDRGGRGAGELLVEHRAKQGREVALDRRGEARRSHRLEQASDDRVPLSEQARGLEVARPRRSHHLPLWPKARGAGAPH